MWLDIGGGTAENLLMVSQRMDLGLFSQIFVVDYSDSMCAHAEARVAANGWKNVTVVQADASTFRPDAKYGRVGFVTMSYSLSMIPGYCALIDTIASYSDAETRIIVADFFTSKKNDSPLRQHSWWRRWAMQVRTYVFTDMPIVSGSTCRSTLCAHTSRWHTFIPRDSACFSS